MSTDTTTTGTTDSPSTAPASTAPHTRWGAIIWGMLLATASASMIGMLSTADRRDGLVHWVAALTPEAVGAIALLAVGVLVLVCGAIGLIRRAQHRSASRRERDGDTLA